MIGGTICKSWHYNCSVPAMTQHCVFLETKVMSLYLIINLFSQMVFLDIVQVEQPMYFSQPLLPSGTSYWAPRQTQSLVREHWRAVGTPAFGSFFSTPWPRRHKPVLEMRVSFPPLFTPKSSQIWNVCAHTQEYTLTRSRVTLPGKMTRGLQVCVLRTKVIVHISQVLAST